MRILSINVKRLKSIQIPHAELTFYNPATDIPTHTVIVGENGIGKSTFLEALTLPSYVCVMKWSDTPPDYNEEEIAIIDIKMMLSDCSIDEDNNVNNDGSEGTVVFFRKKDEAAFITEHLTDENQIQEWYWYADTSTKLGQDFKIGLLQQSIANHPPKPAGDDDDLVVAFRENRSQEGCEVSGTLRCRKLRHWDKQKRDLNDAMHDARAIRPTETQTMRKDRLNKEKTKTITALSKVNNDRRTDMSSIGNIYYINTDQNTYGIGNHILESAKNIPANLAKIFHQRLPATELTEVADEDGTWNGQLRDLGEINHAWQSIFGKPLDGSTQAQKMQRAITSVRCNSDGVTKFEMMGFSPKPYRPKYLSSGENEAFFVLATIVSCKLYNCVVLLDEPELHMHLKQQIKYYICLKEIFATYNIQAIIISHSHFIADRVFTEKYVPDPDKDFTDELAKLIDSTAAERETKSQIREIGVKQILQTELHPTALQINSNREEILDKLRNQSLSYFLT